MYLSAIYSVFHSKCPSLGLTCSFRCRSPMASSSSVPKHAESLPFWISGEMGLASHPPSAHCWVSGTHIVSSLSSEGALVCAASSTRSLMLQSGALTPQSIPEEHLQPEENSLQEQFSLGSELYFSPRQVLNS